MHSFFSLFSCVRARACVRVRVRVRECVRECVRARACMPLQGGGCKEKGLLTLGLDEGVKAC